MDTVVLQWVEDFHLHPWIPDAGLLVMGETAPCTGCQFRSYITSWRTLPLPQHCHLLEAITQSSKGYSTIWSSQLLQEGGEYGKTRKAQIVGLLARFFWCKLVPCWEVKMCVMLWQWIRHSIHKRWVGSRGSKSITRVRTYSSKNKILLLLWWGAPASASCTWAAGWSPGEWYHIAGPVLASAAGRQSAQQWPWPG